MAAHQAPPSLGFSRQEHWSGLPFPSPMLQSEKWKWSHSVVSDPQRPHGLQPSRLLYPWDFPGRSTGVGYHCLLQHITLQLASPIRKKNKQLPTCLQPMKNHNSPPQALSFLQKRSPSPLFTDQPMFQQSLLVPNCSSAIPKWTNFAVKITGHLVLSEHRVHYFNGLKFKLKFKIRNQWFPELSFPLEYLVLSVYLWSFFLSAWSVSH